MKLLRLTVTVNSTSAPYNQFSLGFKNNINQTICSLFSHDIKIDKSIEGCHCGGSILAMVSMIRKLVSKNDYDIIHIHSGLIGVIFLFALLPFNLALTKKTVFTLHNSWDVLRFRNKILVFIAMLTSREVCACSTSSLHSIPRFVNYFIDKKVKAVVNGFDHQRIERVKVDKKSIIHFDKNSKIKIVYIGALNNTKNQIALLTVLKEFRMDGELIFLGDGSNKDFLKLFSKDIPSSLKITFKGRVARNVAIEHMLEADVFISLSKGEGMPIAVLESMYAGCFMVLSKIPPHGEILPPKEGCFFVEPSNKDEIINALNYIVNNIKVLKNDNANSIEHAANNFSLEAMLDKYLKIYTTLSSK